MNKDELLQMLEVGSDAYSMTGSRYICDPPPMDTDEDYIVLAHDFSLSILYYEIHGFKKFQEKDYPDPNFISLRLGEYNLIVTKSEAYYNRFCAATELAKKRNLLNKEDRINLFDMVLYGKKIPKAEKHIVEELYNPNKDGLNNEII